MKIALLAIALVLSTLPASSGSWHSTAIPGSRQYQRESQACSLRDDLYGIRRAIEPLQNSGSRWVNTWGIWRDEIWAPNWLADLNHRYALIPYELFQSTIAGNASDLSGLSYDAVKADLDPAKSPMELNLVIDRLLPLTAICPTQTVITPLR